MHVISDIVTDLAVAWANQTGVQAALLTKAGATAKWVTTVVREGVDIKRSRSSTWRPGAVS